MIDKLYYMRVNTMTNKTKTANTKNTANAKTPVDAKPVNVSVSSRDLLASAKFNDFDKKYLSRVFVCLNNDTHKPIDLVLVDVVDNVAIFVEPSMNDFRIFRATPNADFKMNEKMIVTDKTADLLKLTLSTVRANRHVDKFPTHFSALKKSKNQMIVDFCAKYEKRAESKNAQTVNTAKTTKTA